MMTKSLPRAVLLLAPALLFFACGVPEQEELLESEAALAGAQALLPSSDVAKSGVLGIGDSVALYRNVDDGTSFQLSDNAQAFVRGANGFTVATHTAGYAGAPAGTVTDVAVHYRAQRGTASGTISTQVELLDGTTVVAKGAVRVPGSSWVNYSETFSGLNLADANQLRTRMVLRNTGSGGVRYTQIWIEVKVSGSTAEADAGTTPPPSTDAGVVTPPPPTGSAPYLPYGPFSFFQKPLGNAPVYSRSSEGIAFVKAHPDQKGVAYPVINGLGSNAWGTVYFEGNCTDPVWKLTGNVPAAVSHLATEGFHAPAALGETFTGTSDSPFVVMDRCGNATMPRGLSVWAANAAKGTGYTIRVSTAGAFQHDSNGLDKRNPRSNSTRNLRSRGAIPDAMVIRKDRLQWAIANDTGLGYVLHMFWVETRTTDGFVHPMIGTEGDKQGWGTEGMRIRVKPGVDLTKRGLTPGGLAVARTLQTHGAYLGDNSGSGSALKAEQNYGQWGSLLTRDALKGLTWDDFEFVEPGYEAP